MNKQEIQSLEDLLKSKDKYVVKSAKALIKLNYPKSTKFEIVLEPRIIYYDINNKEKVI